MKTREMPPEYDFSSGTRGKYSELYARGSNVIVLAPDVSKFFHNSAAVNDALRGLLRLADTANRKRINHKRVTSSPRKRRKTA